MTKHIRIKALTSKIVGWINYFGLADMKNVAANLDEWIRRRLRMCIWKQWRKVKTRFKNLYKLGLDKVLAWQFANTRKGYWRISSSPILSRTLTNQYLVNIGFISLSHRYSLVRSS